MNLKMKNIWLKFFIVASILDWLVYLIFFRDPAWSDNCTYFCIHPGTINIMFFLFLIFPMSVALFFADYLDNILKNRKLKLGSGNEETNKKETRNNIIKIFLSSVIIFIVFASFVEMFFLPSLSMYFSEIALAISIIALAIILINYFKKTISSKDFWILFLIIVVGSSLFFALFGETLQSIKNTSEKRGQSREHLKIENKPEVDKVNVQTSKVDKLKSDENSVEVSKNETTSWKTYTNTEYGFSLNFPQTWKEYTTKNRTLNWGSFGTSDSIDFGFSFQDSLFNISIHTKNKWQQLKSEKGPTPTYLGENSQYVFGYSTGQDAANDTVVARMSEISTIIKTFKITK